jgi:hypothetical protein
MRNQEDAEKQGLFLILIKWSKASEVDKLNSKVKPFAGFS